MIPWGWGEIAWQTKWGAEGPSEEGFGTNDLHHIPPNKKKWHDHKVVEYAGKR